MKKQSKTLLSFVTTSALIAGLSLSAFASDVGIVRGSSVNMREKPTTDAAVLEKVIKDSVVEILEQQGEWFKVTYNAKEGYMSTDYVALLGDGEAAPQTAYGVITASSLNLRAKATTDSEVVADVPRDSVVSILTSAGDFFQVKFGETVGFAHKDYVKIGEQAATEIVKKGLVTAGGSLNIRASASTSADVVGKAPSGAAVGVISAADGWCQVVYNGTTGYASSDYIQIGKEVVSRNTFSRPAYSSAGASVVAFAKTLQGIPYRYGGSSLKGFDCSGFVKYVYAEFGVSLPRVSGDQYRAGDKVSKSNLQAGDIVAFGYGRSIGHVGIYIGGGQFIHAPSPGKVVEIDTINSGYYNSHYIGGCRVL